MMAKKAKKAKKPAIHAPVRWGFLAEVDPSDKLMETNVSLCNSAGFARAPLRVSLDGRRVTCGRCKRILNAKKK